MDKPPIKAEPSPEMALVIACATTVIDLQAIQRCLEARLNWELVVEYASAHSVMAFIYAALAEHFEKQVPEDVLQRMKAYFIGNVQNNMLMAKELRELIDLLSSHGITAIPYKGLALAHLAYPDPDMREISDIDVFVRRRDLTHVKQILPSHGYPLIETTSDHRAFERYSYHYAFQRARSGRLVEVHWKFLRDSQLLAPDDEWPWARVKKIEFACISTFTFTPEDWLLLLCAHGAKHWWSHLSNVCDVAELIRRQPVDWDGLEAEAEKRHARRILYLGLLVAHDLLRVPIPLGVLDHARADEQAVGLANRTCTLIRAGHIALERFSSVEGIVYDLEVRDHVGDKLGWIFQHLFEWEPNEHDKMLLKGAPPIVYRWLRAARLVATYTSALSGHLLRQR